MELMVQIVKVIKLLFDHGKKQTFHLKFTFSS